MTKPEQPDADSYHPTTSAPIQFEHTWKAVRVNPRNVGPEFPFRVPDLLQNRHPVHFLEFRALCDPPPDLGNPGDIWLNVSPPSYALFALNAEKEWVRWPGPTLDTARMIPHPYLPVYALWCTIKQASWYHRDKLPADWTGTKLTARQELGGYHCGADMVDASVGVRLVLLWEGMTQTTSTTPSPTTSVGAQLKSALGQLTETSAISETTGALISTLSAGIDYLLVERIKLKDALSVAQEQAASAEAKLKALSESVNHVCSEQHAPSSSRPEPAYLPTDIYIDRLLAVPILQSPTASTAYAPYVYQALNGVHSPPTADHPDKRRKTPSLPAHSPNLPDNATPSPTLTSKHLAILYRKADEGRSKNCRICLTLVADEDTPLITHALTTHPAECAVFARAPEDVLDANLKKFAEMDG
ncbi:hypothetical protein DFH09DRAFT_1491513 [Mycena vulgaris]|nr:hypothetical protein DFH09DRAFT_1491513 [Mycena vulgaris]